MILRNPCYNCLVKACCNIKCEKKKEFVAFYEYMMIINVLFSIFVFILTLYLLPYIHYIYFWLITFILNMFIYITINKKFPIFIKQVIIFFMLGPVLFIFISLIMLFERFTRAKHLRTLEH